MRRITILVFVCLFAFGGISKAKADGIDVKVSGYWDFAFGWVDNKVFADSVNRAKDVDNDNFAARQRIRTQINFITSEYLQAVLMFEIGDLDWGRPGTSGRSSGAALDADGVNVETKRAYLDWLIPNTEISVRMGIQGFSLPASRMVNPVIDADVAGIVLSSPITDWLSATGFWFRPFDQYRNSGTWDGAYADDGNFSDTVDLFGLVLPAKLHGWSLSPYFLYGWVGANSGFYDYLFRSSSNFANTVDAEDSRAKAWWLGTNLKITVLDPLTLDLDIVYGHLNRADLSGFNSADATRAPVPGQASWGTEGWYIGAALDYKLDFMTPGIFAWWASGDKKSDYEDGMLGRLPTLGGSTGWRATSFGGNGFHPISNGDNNPAITDTGTGIWGIGAQLADITFVKNLKHTLRVAYYEGTNDSDLVKEGTYLFKHSRDAMYLTDKDSVWEVNFNHQYKIYENLITYLELGYLHLNSDRDTWKRNGGGDENDSAWKAEVMFRYSF